MVVDLHSGTNISITLSPTLFFDFVKGERRERMGKFRNGSMKAGRYDSMKYQWLCVENFPRLR